jgi:hypothetical protein
MNILFHNYSNELTTEPAYLSNALSQCGIKAGLWNDPNLSAFDVLDSVQPDVLVTSRLTMTKDIMTYLSQSNIELILNITGIASHQLKMMIDTLTEAKIRVPFVFTNSFKSAALPDGGIKCYNIWPAADLFNMQAPREARLQECIIAQKFDENVENYIGKTDQYHLLYLSAGNLIPPFDLAGNVLTLRNLYKVYKTITVIGDLDFCSSQLFFDANLQAHNISYLVNEDQAEDFSDVIQAYLEPDKANLQDDINDSGIQRFIKDQIKARHTPFHRARTLMKYLKDQESMAKVELVKNRLPEILKDI